MHLPTARDVLQTWERGESLHPLDRALSFLRIGFPEMDWEELASLSVGQRDAHLLMLCQTMFGPLIDCAADCPACAEPVEFTADIRNFRPAEAMHPKLHEPELIQDDYRLGFRLPDSRDLAALVPCGNAEEARLVLLHRCVLSATKAGQDVSIENLPDAIVSGLSEHITRFDPLAEIILNMGCPVCDHQWHLLFDIVSLFWRQLEQKAARLMDEVHSLALAYGWREADVLSMSPRRLRAYLDRVGYG